VFTRRRIRGLTMSDMAKHATMPGAGRKRTVCFSAYYGRKRTLTSARQFGSEPEANTSFANAAPAAGQLCACLVYDSNIGKRSS
jgi:hypothetical protein